MVDSKRGADPARALYEAGREAWPALPVSREQFTSHAARFDPPPTRGPDLYLACACASGDSAAIEAFETTYAKAIDGVIARFARQASARDELRQLLRQHLFVPTQGEPRITAYAGRGFLENWLRVTAVRLFINAQRGQNPAAPGEGDDPLAELPDRGDLELGFLRAHYRVAFRRAFSQAVTGLEPQDRALLRLQLVDGLSVSQLGAVLGVHRATAARRVAQARDRLVSSTIDQLKTMVSIDDSDLASLRHIIGSQLDLSLSRLFAEDVQ